MPRTLAAVTTGERPYPAFIDVKQRVSKDEFVLTVRGGAYFDNIKGDFAEGPAVHATLSRAELLDLLTQLGELENAIDPK
jgi:hypothetical protein